jgi:ribosome modulation factor
MTIANDPGAKRDLAAHTKGVEAGLSGKTPENSPYPEWSLNHKYWLRGLIAGAQQRGNCKECD